MSIIKFFSPKDQYYELSNFYLLDSPLIYCGKTFMTSEHLYQYIKYPIDSKYAEEIRTANTPYKAKLLANKSLNGSYEWQKELHKKVLLADSSCRDDWEQIRDDVMLFVLRIKYAQNKHCRDILLSTVGSSLMENSPYDTYWGIGKYGTGKNVLGKLLEQVRAELLSQ